MHWLARDLSPTLARYLIRTDTPIRALSPKHRADGSALRTGDLISQRLVFSGLLFGCPEDLADLFQRRFEGLRRFHIDVLLSLTSQFAGVPDQLVQVRVLLQMLGLEVVGPDDEDLVLRLCGMFFFGGRIG